MTASDAIGGTAGTGNTTWDWEAEREAAVALSLCHGLGAVGIGRLRAAHGTAHAAIGGNAETWAAALGCSVDRAARLRQRVDLGGARREIDAGRAVGAAVVAVGEPAYPTLLGAVPDPPPFLWCQGSLDAKDAWAVAVVGSRRASAYGRDQAARFARGFAERGHTVVSGGARGIDAEAHRAALRTGGRTIAVLGSGLACPYPPEHAGLFREIADGRGAVLSEFPMSMPPRAELFPRRNRIVSGLSLGVLVIEARARSGAAITARIAVEDHGREAMALPGRVDSPTSEGCHRAIREGWAGLVTSVDEAIEQLGSSPQLVAGALAVSALQPASRELSVVAVSIGRALADGPADRERLVDRLVSADIDVGAAFAELTLLELRGLILRGSDGQYDLCESFREVLPPTRGSEETSRP
ncbi:MAG: DNA-protecting protein DprA [Phycisphaerae bacterium]|nr:DNA-protecting protein DprA [Phycisphaerae bacterium]